MATLYIVGTPIGNLADITLRAIEALREVSIIFAEDTRITRRLTERYDISTPLTPFHQHSGEKILKKALEILTKGNDIAFVTDAGTPGISDPGGKLVHYIYEKSSHHIVPIPGVSALSTALSISGFPTDRFTFYGFIPHKKGRKTMIESILKSDTTSVFFESPHRIQKTLEQIEENAEKDKKIVIVREATKKFETIYRGSTQDIATLKTAVIAKGEFTVIIGP